MKNQIMIGLLAMGLITGCASNDDMDDDAVIEESSGGGLGTKFSELPAAVQKTIREVRPGGRIDDIDKEMRSGQTVYEIQFADPGRNPKLHIAEDGSLEGGR